MQEEPWWWNHCEMYVRMQYWRQAVHGWMLMYLSYLRNFLQSGLMHLSQYWKIELLMSWGFELMGLVASTCVKPEGLMCLHACSLQFLFFCHVLFVYYVYHPGASNLAASSWVHMIFIKPGRLTMSTCMQLPCTHGLSWRFKSYRLLWVVFHVL